MTRHLHSGPISEFPMHAHWVSMWNQRTRRTRVGIGSSLSRTPVRLVCYSPHSKSSGGFLRHFYAQIPPQQTPCPRISLPMGDTLSSLWAGSKCTELSRHHSGSDKAAYRASTSAFGLLGASPRTHKRCLSPTNPPGQKGQKGVPLRHIDSKINCSSIGRFVG